jgi:nitrogen regulatory protein PII
MSEPALAPLPTDALVRMVAIVRPARLDAVMAALVEVAPRDVLVEQVRGYGRQKTHLDFYEEGSFEGGFLPKVRLQFVVAAECAAAAATAICAGARTGRIGDGKIFVHMVVSGAGAGAPGSARGAGA